MMDVLGGSTSDLQTTAPLARHFPLESHGKPHWRRTLNHRVRLTTKQYCEQHPGEVPCRTHGMTCQYRTNPHLGREDESALRHHAAADLKGAMLEHAPSRRPRRPNTRAWPLEEDDALALARGDDPLPGDRFRLMQRHPSLEREDAFCDTTTFKTGVRVKQLPNTDGDEDAQIAELYRMGLLYDDAEKRRRDKSNFSLNDIQHDEPIYSIRPARRSRRVSKSRPYDGPLPLNLSFADLGDDNDLARYLDPRHSTSGAVAGSSATGPDSFQHTSGRRQTSAPLRVIYELATSRPSFDVDTSQPPDLMSDSLSDYDCFSDSELDDAIRGPSQREVHDASTATASSGPWVLLGDDS